MTNAKGIGLRVVHIMGTAHCGSTILGGALASYSDMINVGEIHRIGLSAHPLAENLCACGEVAENCPYWSRVYQSWVDAIAPLTPEKYRGYQMKFERLRSFPRIMIEKLKPSPAFRQYISATLALYRSISLIAESNDIVDTSKYPVRGIALSLIPDLNLQLVHLVRDGRGVIWSRKKKSVVDGSIESTKQANARVLISAILDWIVVNIFSEFARMNSRGAYIQIRYEDFVSNPREPLSRLTKGSGIQTDRVIEALQAGKPISFGHDFAGNPVRLKGPVIFKLDEQWKHKISHSEKRNFWIFAGWLARKYGYLRDPQTSEVEDS